jgi:Fe-S cluster biogenesis protein NfuA
MPGKMGFSCGKIAAISATKEMAMVNREDVAAVLELIRPSLQADGGDVQLIDVNDEGVVRVELQGACKGCPMSQMTLANGVERILKDRVPGVTKVVPA